MGLLELGDLEAGVEHPLDEGRLPEDLVRLARQLQLFHNLVIVVNSEREKERERERDRETEREREKERACICIYIL